MNFKMYITKSQKKKNMVKIRGKMQSFNFIELRIKLIIN
jgi:hypothetical protein